MGLGQKVKRAMGVGHTEEEPFGAQGSAYQNVGATYGAEGTSGIAAPVDPGTATTASDMAAAPVGKAGNAGTGYGTAGREGETDVYTDTGTATAEVPMAVQTTSRTTGAAAPVETGEAATCGREHFTRVEDRPVVKERVELVKESNPVEKEFVTETRATGAERELGSTEVENLGTTERVVAAEGPKLPCE